MKTLATITIIVLMMAMSAHAKPIVTRVLVPDTTYKTDTIITVDTLIVTSTYKDTAVFVKNDTIQAKAKKIIGKR